MPRPPAAAPSDVPDPIRLLAVSGSARAGSSNTALLRAMAAHAPPGIEVTIFDALASLPVFSPDLDGEHPPDPVRAFRADVAAADALIVASPEYVRTLPGGLKNAIDWLVSGAELIDKPAAIAHASHRGDDLLEALRTVLGTVTSGFDPTCFVRVPLVSSSETAVDAALGEPETVMRLRDFLSTLGERVRDRRRADGRDASARVVPASVPGPAETD